MVRDVLLNIQLWKKLHLPLGKKKAKQLHIKEKRKSIDTNRNKNTKAKTAKLNGEQIKTKVSKIGNNNRNTNTQSKLTIDLSTNKRTDHSINHIMLQNHGLATNNSSTTLALSIFSATTAALSQPSKHSSNTQIKPVVAATNKQHQLQQSQSSNQTAQGKNSHQ